MKGLWTRDQSFERYADSRVIEMKKITKNTGRRNRGLGSSGLRRKATWIAAQFKGQVEQKDQMIKVERLMIH